MPPGISSHEWDKLVVWEQVQFLAYNQIREYEEAELNSAIIGSRL